jgi:hypothetical protein
MPVDDIEGTWKVCSPKTVGDTGWGGFSAQAAVSVVTYGSSAASGPGFSLTVPAGQTASRSRYCATYAPAVRSIAKRAALRDFLSVFEHRFIAGFYRAWEKSRSLFTFERAVRQVVNEILGSK